MDAEERELLDRIVDLSEENNKILRKMQRAHKISTIFSIIYYIILIGAAIGAYYYLQPYLDSLMRSYGSFKNAFDHIQHLGQATPS